MRAEAVFLCPAVSPRPNARDLRRYSNNYVLNRIINPSTYLLACPSKSKPTTSLNKAVSPNGWTVMFWLPQRERLAELPWETEACNLESVHTRVWCEDEMILMPVALTLALWYERERKACSNITLWGQCDNVKINSQQMLLAWTEGNIWTSAEMKPRR